MQQETGKGILTAVKLLIPLLIQHGTLLRVNL